MLRYQFMLLWVIASLFLAGCGPMVQPTVMRKQLTQARIKADIAIAYALMQSERYQQAKAQLMRALAVSPKSVLVQLALAQYYERMHQTHKARLMYEKLMHQASGDSRVQYHYGSFLCTQHQADKALVLLHQATEANDATASMQFALAQCAAVSGHNAIAEHAYQQTLLLDAHFLKAYLPYVKLLVQQKQWAKAQQILTRYWKKVPQDEASLILAVVIARAQGKTPRQAYFQLKLNSMRATEQAQEASPGE